MLRVMWMQASTSSVDVLFYFVSVSVRTPGKKEEKNRLTGTMSTLDDAPFAFIFFIRIVDEYTVFNDVTIVLPGEAWDRRLVCRRLDAHDACKCRKIGLFEHAERKINSKISTHTVETDMQKVAVKGDRTARNYIDDQKTENEKHTRQQPFSSVSERVSRREYAVRGLHVLPACSS